MAVSLKTFRSILRKFKWLCDSSKIPGEFQVIDIFAYVADATFLSSLTPPVIIYKKTVIILHDIVITDGEDKLKCFLALPLSDLVQKCILKVGDYIQINSVKLCYLEGEYRDQHIVSYVLLEDIQVLERAVVTLPDLTRLRFLPSNNARETELIPLVTSRRHYLHVWYLSPYGSMWTDASSVTLKPNDPIPHTLQKLEDLNRVDWRRLPKPYPPLLLRIIYRGLLNYYGHNLADRPLPFLGFLLAADHTGFTTMLCFDKRNPGVYYNSFPGTVILVESYVLQEIRREKPVPSSVGSLRNLIEINAEIVLGNYSVIRIIPNDCSVFAQEISHLPLVEYTFVERASLVFVAETVLVDVVGLITYVSRFARFRYKYSNLKNYYWVEVIDNSSHLPIRILLYVDVNKFSHTIIHPGQILVATQLKVCRISSDIISDQHAAIYLQASVFTELSIDHQDKPYHRHPTVLKICNLIRDHPEEITYIRDNILRIGGTISLTHPPLPVDLESFKKLYESSYYALKLEPGATWNKIFENLCYREIRRFAVGGFVVHVEFVDMQTVHSNGPAYGWPYCHNVKSRRTLFLNIKMANKLKNLQQSMNMSYSDMFSFPQKYSNAQKEELLSSRDYPPVNAENWKPGAGNVVQSIPFQGDGYYLITIVSLHYQNLFQCILTPEPAVAPYPSFLELLSGQYELVPMRKVKTFISEPPQYTWNEVKKVQRTVSEAANKTFVFSLEAFCPTMGKYEVFLRRGYLCPPNQITEIMEADGFV